MRARRSPQKSRFSFAGASERLVVGALASTGLFAACGGSAPAAAPETAEVEPATETAPSAPTEDNSPEATVSRLIEEFDDAARNGTATDEAQAFIREHEKALVRIYVDDYAELSPKGRIALINLLVSFNTDGTAEAHTAAIARYASGDGSVDEAIWACQAAKRLRNPKLASSLMSAFNAIDMSDADGQRFGRHLADAMEFNVVPSWMPTLEKHRDATIPSLASNEDKAEVKRYRNAKYWQETSVRLLERLKAGDAK